MSGTVIRSKNATRTKRVTKPIVLSKVEMIQKMLADQKIIREALQNGTPLIELEKTHGYRFARL